MAHSNYIRANEHPERNFVHNDLQQTPLTANGQFFCHSLLVRSHYFLAETEVSVPSRCETTFMYVAVVGFDC